MKSVSLAVVIALIVCIFSSTIDAKNSVARQWNEVMLSAIRKDLARPPVQARNLFHISAAMYDAWAVYDNTAKPYFLGKTVGGFTIPFTGISAPVNLQAAREEAVSYAAYRLLKYRYKYSPNAKDALPRFDSLFLSLGYDTLKTSTDY